MANHIRAFDWAATPIGPLNAWPQSLRTAIDLMLDSRQPVYIAWGPELTSLYNDSVIPILGERHPDALGIPFSAALAEIWDDIRPAVEATLAGEAQHFVDRPLAIKGRAGRPMSWFTFTLTPLRNDAGEIAGFFGAAIETTEKVLTEDARLRAALDAAERQQRLYETITSNTPDLVYVFALDYSFAYANRALLEMWGRTWEDSIGRRLLEVGYEPWHAEMHEREIDQIVVTKQPVRGEVSFPHATLGRRVYDYILTPVLDADGNVEAVSGTTRDITELRRLSQQKDEFIGIVSHELRTPVTSIKAYAQILHRRFRATDDEKSAEMVARMDRQLNRLAGLIGDLLDVTKIEAGQLQFRDERFDIDDLIDDVISELQHTTERHRIERDGHAHAEFNGDRERIGQVMTNLLSNAIKYSPEANRIIVHARSDAEQVVISVQDFGVGIAEEDREHVFERFYRVSEPEHDAFSGIGLGLYISAEIVRRQGGRIWVEGARGSGSTFYVALPLSPGATP